jgi:LPPG:FO 2-phospho-L-lactate transferase
MRIAALAGGVGGAKLLLGLTRAMDARELTIIANTGDDIVLHGLHISPDPDIITYTLAGVVNPETGWGFKDETFNALSILAKLGGPDWFRLGDRDLAVHIWRTALMTEGRSLSDAAGELGLALGVKARILPMSDDPVTTMLDTDEGVLHLQEYLVKRRAEPRVRTISFAGSEEAQPTPGVLDALREADGIIICPSNPLISIGPILALAGMREALSARKGKVVAVCPLVGGKSLKGPSDKMMAELGHDASAVGVARLYSELAGTFVIDQADADSRTEIEALGMRAVISSTIMRDLADKERLAREVLRLFDQ